MDHALMGRTVGSAYSATTSTKRKSHPNKESGVRVMEPNYIKATYQAVTMGITLLIVLITFLGVILSGNLIRRT